MPVATEKFNIKKAQKSVFSGLLDAKSRRGGGRVAVEDADGKQFTYNDIIKASFALGHSLKQGTKKEDVVGIMLPTSAATVISFFALHAYGRIPAMLNFTAGLANVQAACNISGLKRIVTSRKFIELANLQSLLDSLSNDYEILYLEDVKENLTKSDKLHAILGFIAPWAIRYKPHWDDMAVILFTSGTEGKPKGVVLSHQNIVSNVFQILQHVPEALTPEDVLFNPLPTFHCFGLTAGVLLPIIGGMKSMLHPSPLQTKEIVSRLGKGDASLLFATDTFLNQYARASKNQELVGLRFAVCGAESVKEETRQLVKRQFGLEILEGYGATEAAPVIAVNQPSYNRAGTVGRALPGMEISFEPVEGITNAGRMKVRGPNVMKGYIDPENPEQIQELPENWHDTGDIVNFSKDGTLSIRGRLKRFAKIGGEMVSLGVVENCAKAVWPEYEHAAAVLPDKRKGEQIILLSTNPKADRVDLLRWLQHHGVAELSLPRKVIPVEEIPLLGSGKVDFGGVQKLAKSLTEDKQDIEEGVLDEAAE